MICRTCAALLVAWLVSAVPCAIAAEPDKPNSTFGEFVGSTPNQEPFRSLLKIDSGVEPPIRWRLTLFADPQTAAPAGYQLHCAYDVKTSIGPIPWKRTVDIERSGTWSIGKGTASNPGAVVYELQDFLALAQIDRGLLHLLSADRTLMVGNGGWSCTLNRADMAEKPGDPAIVNGRPSLDYKITPLDHGPNVLGAFEGRTPFDGIAQDLNLTADVGFKAKWRITLYQDPGTHAPTMYKVEGTLHWRGAREGTWTIERGTKTDPAATVYRLAPGEGQMPLLLLAGDRNVLFFLNQQLCPLVGHGDFSYTLNRREPEPAGGG